MRISKYQGKYKIKNAPNKGRMKSHNIISWERIETIIENAGGTAEFEDLVAAVKDHVSGNKSKPHPYQFVNYCIDRGWLEPVLIIIAK